MVANEHFLEDCELQFTELDQNGDGVLTPDELYPVIKVSAWAILKVVVYCYDCYDCYEVLPVTSQSS